MSVDEDEPGGAVDVPHGGDRAKQDGAVRAVEQREAAGQRLSHALVHRRHHLHQCALVEEAGQRAASRVGVGHHDVRRELGLGERRRQAGLAQPRRRGGLPTRPAGPVEAHPDEP